MVSEVAVFLGILGTEEGFFADGKLFAVGTNTFPVLGIGVLDDSASVSTPGSVGAFHSNPGVCHQRSLISVQTVGSLPGVSCGCINGHHLLYRHLALSFALHVIYLIIESDKVFGEFIEFNVFILDEFRGDFADHEFALAFGIEQVLGLVLVIIDVLLPWGEHVIEFLIELLAWFMFVLVFNDLRHFFKCPCP